jgi:hypothetical protein
MQNAENVDLTSHMLGTLIIQNCEQQQTADNLELSDIIPYKHGPGAHLDGTYGEWELARVANWWP